MMRILNFIHKLTPDVRRFSSSDTTGPEFLFVVILLFEICVMQ